MGALVYRGGARAAKTIVDLCVSIGKSITMLRKRSDARTKEQSLSGRYRTRRVLPCRSSRMSCFPHRMLLPVCRLKS